MRRYFLPFAYFFFALFLLFPLFVVLKEAFFVEVPGRGEVFSLNYFVRIFTNYKYSACFLNSFLIATFSTVACLAICIPLALLFDRCSFPGKPYLSAALLLPLILPPFVGAIGIKQVFARFGSLNILLQDIGLLGEGQHIDWFGEGGFIGIVILEVLHLYPIMFLSIQAALANIDPSLRDAARNLGAQGFHIFRTVTLPLVMPGVFAGGSIVFISAFTDLGVPLMFDYQTTVPSQIFNLVTQTDNPEGYALVVVMLVIVSVLFLVGKRLGEGNYAMLARSATYDDTTRLTGAPAYLAVGSVVLLILVSILPHIGVIMQAFAAKWFMTVLPSEYTGEFFLEILENPITRTSMGNSLFYATLAAGLDVMLGVVIAYLLARENFAGKTVLDVLAMMPLALPGLVMAFAYYVAFSQPLIPEGWFGSFGAQVNATWKFLFDPRTNPTLLLVIAYAIHRLPYIVRAAYAGLQQTSVTLEEASANMGATPFQTLAKITLPLISANLIAGTIMTFSFAMLDVSNGMMLAQETPYYPLTKAIYALMGRITPTAPSLACAMGVVAMIFLAFSLFGASRLLGQKMGQLFRA